MGRGWGGGGEGVGRGKESLELMVNDCTNE